MEPFFCTRRVHLPSEGDAYAPSHTARRIQLNLAKKNSEHDASATHAAAKARLPNLDPGYYRLRSHSGCRLFLYQIRRTRGAAKTIRTRSIRCSDIGRCGHTE
jgi:hypothetical protein